MAALAACGGDEPRPAVKAVAVAATPEINFTAIESLSLQFLPRQQEAEGWRLVEDPIVIPADRLSIYLDQAATLLQRYEVVDATIGNYAANAGEGFATVEIYRFPDFVKAFGAYSAAKSGPAQYLQIANEAFQGKHSLHLWRGPFYVRIIGGGSPDSSAALQRLMSFVAERMPQAPGKPAVFNFFPVEMRVPNSERFSAISGFGQRILANSYQATFGVGGDPMEGLIIPASNKAAATRILDAYRALYIRNGKLLDPISNLGEDNFTAEDRFLGRAVAFRLDRFVIAFNGYKERQRLVDLAIATDARILGSIRKQLVSAEKQAEAAASGTPRRNENLPPWARNP
ncbi:MAG: hypothetical protein JJE51_14295 [Thermoanaerobaculia bacterium]|nr:hypothetical protein [Thermoanaerobaculia bacterium]